MIAMVFTGGTISMRVDPLAGGAVPALDARDILAAARGIEDVATLRIEEWGRFPGPHMDAERMWNLRARLIELVADPAIDGVVVTHGTDTIEETAYLVARSLYSTKPIVFTGAMRNLSELGWDGPANLVDAVRVAADPDAIGYGVLLVMNGRAYSALDVTKAHTHVLDAFESPGLGPVAEVDDEAVIFRRALPLQREIIQPVSLATPIDIVGAWAGADARLLDAVLPTARGVVIAALGRGNVPPLMADALGAWRDAGKPVVITSRTGRGRVGQTYGYPGGGRRLAELGTIFAGARRPTQARIDLMLALGAGLAGDALGAVFSDS
jgi:L-asparaginase